MELGLWNVPGGLGSDLLEVGWRVWGGPDLGFCSRPSGVQIPPLLSTGTATLGMVLSLANLHFLLSTVKGNP